MMTVAPSLARIRHTCGATVALWTGRFILGRRVGVGDLRRPNGDAYDGGGLRCRACDVPVVLCVASTSEVWADTDPSPPTARIGTGGVR